jgi:hypothetical protein
MKQECWPISRNVQFEGKRRVERPRRRWDYKTYVSMSIYSTGSGWGPVASSCEHSTEPSDPIKGVQLLDQLSDCQLLKKNMLHRRGEYLLSEFVSLMAFIFYLIYEQFILPADQTSLFWGGCRSKTLARIDVSQVEIRTWYAYLNRDQPLYRCANLLGRWSIPYTCIQI